MHNFLTSSEKKRAWKVKFIIVNNHLNKFFLENRLDTRTQNLSQSSDTLRHFHTDSAYKRCVLEIINNSTFSAWRTGDLEHL